MDDTLTYEERLIAKAQVVVRNAGFRWEERTFNDDGLGDTMVRISKNKGTEPLTHDNDALGWGRFSRLDCWTQARDFVETFGDIETFREAGSPRKRYWERWADAGYGPGGVRA